MPAEINADQIASIERFERSPKVRQAISVLRRQVQTLTADLNAARFDAVEADKSHRAALALAELEAEQARDELSRLRANSMTVEARVIALERDGLRSKANRLAMEVKALKTADSARRLAVTQENHRRALANAAAKASGPGPRNWLEALIHGWDFVR